MTFFSFPILSLYYTVNYCISVLTVFLSTRYKLELLRKREPHQIGLWENLLFIFLTDDWMEELNSLGAVPSLFGGSGCLIALL